MRVKYRFTKLQAHWHAANLNLKGKSLTVIKRRKKIRDRHDPSTGCTNNRDPIRVPGQPLAAVGHRG
jgi:hypothetical protein